MNRGGFTLLELMITISIVFIVSMSVYMPYSHYQKKADFNLAVKQVVQLIEQSRSSAIHGNSEGVNSSFGVYLDSENQNAQLISYPYSYSGTIDVSGENITAVKNLEFQKGIGVHSIGGYNNALLIYESISGQLKLYYRDTDNGFIVAETIPGIISIEMSYGDFDVSSFTKTLSYYTATHVIDF